MSSVNDKMGKSVIVIGIMMAAIDYVYLSSIAGSFTKMLYKIQNSDLQLKILPTIFCYLFLILSIEYFIIFKKGSILDAFILGICIYSVYELTNYATIKNWSIELVFIDTLWGGVLFALTTYLHNKIINYI